MLRIEENGQMRIRCRRRKKSKKLQRSGERGSRSTKQFIDWNNYELHSEKNVSIKRNNFRLISQPRRSQTLIGSCIFYMHHACWKLIILPRHDRSPIARSAIWAAIIFSRSHSDRRSSLKKKIGSRSRSRNLTIAILRSCDRAIFRSLVKKRMYISKFIQAIIFRLFMSLEVNK